MANLSRFGSVLSGILFFLLNAGAQSNTPAYSVVHYNNDNSILQNNTWTVAFDRQGYGWIGMETGIVRYDGKNFKLFDKQNLPGVSSFIFTSIVADKKGNLYARDDFGARINIEADGSRGAYAKPDTNHFLIGRKGWLYKGNNYKALLSRFCDSSTLKSIEDNRQFIAVNDSTIYFYESNHLWYLCGNKIKALPLSQPMDLIDGVVVNIALFGDTLISVHKNNQVDCFYKGEVVEAVNNIAGEMAADTGFLRGNFRMLWCCNGSFAYTNGKLYRVFMQNHSLQSELMFANLPAASVVSFYYHPQLRLYFLVTNNDGVFVIKKTSVSTFTAPADTRYNNSYYTIAQTPGSRIAANNVLFDSTGNADPFYLADSRLRLLYNDDDKGLWYGFQDSLKYFSFDDKKNTLALQCRQPVTTYCVSRYDSVLYFSSGFAIFKITDNNTRTQYILDGNSAFDIKEENVPRNKITCLGMFAPGLFILGTYNSLYTYDINLKKVIKLTGGIQARKIYCDAQGNAWICTSGNGFYCYRHSSLTSFQPDYKKNLYSFYECLEDNNGYLWLSTNNGIIVASKENLLRYCSDKNVYVEYRFFDKNDGFVTNEFNGGGTQCAIRMKDGKLIFSSPKGLVSFYPYELRAMDSASSIYIDEIFIDSLHSSASRNVTVPASFSTLTFSVSTPQFVNTSNNRIEYAVSGLTSKWQPLPENGSITFNKLPHGKYTLQLRKGNRTGGYDYLDTPFAVDAFFYETVWFKILFLTLLAGIVYFLVRLRLRIVYKQKEKLESLVHLRTNELNRNISMLQNTIQELEASEEKIYQNSKFKEKLISIILHDLRSPLRFLSSVSGNLAAGYKSMPNVRVQENLDNLSAESANVYHFTNEFLTWIYTQQSDYVIRKKPVKVDPLFTDVQNLYQKIAEQNHNSIRVETSGIACMADESILKIIIRNLVDNAVKYSGNGIIKLSASEADGHVVISIADNGPGIPETVLSPFQQAIADNNNEKTLGLTLVCELIKKSGGDIRFKDNIPMGTIVEVILPAD